MKNVIVIILHDIRSLHFLWPDELIKNRILNSKWFGLKMEHKVSSYEVVYFVFYQSPSEAVPQQ